MVDLGDEGIDLALQGEGYLLAVVGLSMIMLTHTNILDLFTQVKLVFTTLLDLLTQQLQVDAILFVP